VLGACGNGAGTGTAGDKIGALPKDLIPAKVLGLRVSSEKPGDVINGVKRSYVKRLGLYAFREGDLLQATLQVAELDSDQVNVKSTSFREAVAQQVGGSAAQPFRMGESTVFLTSGRKQSITVWFDGNRLNVLSARDTFGQGRTLTRALLEYEAAK
jgi:hypothetical protein